MKKLITFFSFLILTSTVFANSVGGSIGGWNVVSNVASGIGAKITATKDVIVNGASKVVTGTANITPRIADVAKFAAKVGAVSVVVDAMDLVLDGVDYVLDPVNNTVQYKTNVKLDKYSSKYVYYVQDFNTPSYDLNSACTAKTPESTSTDTFSFYDVKDAASGICRYKAFNIETGNNSIFGISFVRYDNPDFKAPAAEQETKSVPLSILGEQVIDQAEKDIKAGNPASPAVALSRAVAQDMIQTAEADQDNVKPNPIATELDKSKTYPSQDSATGTVDTPAVTDPVTGEVVKPAETSNVDIKIPKACEWFPQLCVFLDWMQKEPELDEVDLPKQEKAKKEINEGLISISSNSCPAPYPVSIELPVLKTVYTDSIDISPYCSEIEKLAPVLQLLAFVLAVFIIKDI